MKATATHFLGSCMLPGEEIFLDAYALHGGQTAEGGSTVQLLGRRWAWASEQPSGQVSMGLAAVPAPPKPDCGLQPRVALADEEGQRPCKQRRKQKLGLQEDCSQRPMGETSQDGGEESPEPTSPGHTKITTIHRTTINGKDQNLPGKIFYNQRHKGELLELLQVFAQNP